ncbi:hypothetical protein [Roseivivax lentus]|uniref:hypothetical protein n=1 Tax=Roseivivax lentus TaxID=633194 RepID=UPI001356328C|nr:hypothetical protein [Roseivivax lentus]
MTSNATFTNAASIRAASTDWAERLHGEEGRNDGLMSKSMRVSSFFGQDLRAIVVE